MDKTTLINYLNDYLRIKDFSLEMDDSRNGLQVDNSNTEIRRIWYAVDASTYIFDLAIKEQVDMLIVHHGIFWAFNYVITERNYERISKLIKNDIALYACHLPLDAHPEVWNNIGITQAFINIFWLKNYKLENFDNYHGVFIWYWLKFEEQIHISTIQSIFAQQMGFEKKLYNFGKKEFINSVAIVSWWWGWQAKEALKDWYDLLITGESSHGHMLMAKEMKQSILLGWHRETEKIWVKLLSHHLNKEFGLETVFLDEKY